MEYTFFIRNSYRLCLLKYTNLSSGDQLLNFFDSFTHEYRRKTYYHLIYDLVRIMSYMRSLVFNSEMTGLYYFVNH